jgi:hypothetical protein
MTFLDDLSRAAQSSTSVWHQFVLAHDPERNDWYLFVEGKLDVPFYTAALRPSLAGDCQVVEFQCGGRNGVIAARREVRRSHPDCCRCLFFVDKDFSDILFEPTPQADDVFCTDVYSIENYLVSQEALDVVWCQLWSLATTDPRREVVAQRFGESLAQFYRVILPITAWIVSARRQGLRPNLNNINLADVIAFSDGLPRRRAAAIATLERVTSCAHRPDIATLLGEARQLSKREPKTVVRGKFELWFFARFLEFAFQALRISANDSPDGSIQRQPESIARALTGKISLPMSLVSFATRAIGAGGGAHCGG